MRMEDPPPCEQNLRRSKPALKKGEWVAYGGLEGNSLKVSSHEIINSKDENGVTYFQILGDAQPGYSGGPVFDQHGMVVGVVLRGLTLASGGSLFDAILVSDIP
jgi:S1-C subfamily serine protease